MRAVQLSNSTNWEFLYHTEITAVRVPMQNGSYIHSPIADINVPFVLDNFILAVSVETNVPENSEWHFAGYCRQKINTGLVVGGNYDASRVKRQPLSLDEPNLIFFEKISASYSISIKVPKWFLNASITVWKYIGTDTDSLEDTVVAVGRQVVRTSQDVEAIRATVENRSPFATLNPFGFGL